MCRCKEEFFERFNRIYIDAKLKKYLSEDNYEQHEYP